MSREIKSLLFKLRTGRALLTRDELAARSGVSAKTIERIEFGLHEPRFSTVRKLASVLSEATGETVDPRLLMPEDEAA